MTARHTSAVGRAGNFVAGATPRAEEKSGWRPGLFGSIAYDAGATLVMETGGLTPGEDHDQIIASGTLGLDGTLEVALIDEFVPQEEDAFDLFDWAELDGQFSSYDLPSLPTGLEWDASGLYSDGTLAVVPEPGALSLVAVSGLALIRRRRR